MVKGKVVPEDVWENGGITPPFLTSALIRSEWLASRPGRFTPREIASNTYWIGGRVGPRVGLDAVGKRKISSWFVLLII
jgi:hypothetical protein